MTQVSKEKLFKLDKLGIIRKGSTKQKIAALNWLQENFEEDDTISIMMAMDDEKPSVRAKAAYIAGKLKLKACIRDLRIHLDDKYNSVVEACTNALVEIEDNNGDDDNINWSAKYKAAAKRYENRNAGK